jgi:hypothetical protein
MEATPMWTFSRIGFFFAVIAAWAVVPAHAARKAGGCTQGRFVVTEGQDLLGAAEPIVLVLEGSTLAVDGPCPTRGSATKRRKGTRVRARWDRCGALPKLRLQAMARDCTAVRGTLRAPKKRAAMVAMPSACGDGIVDRGAGEQCEAGQSCGAGVACTASCQCPGAPQPLDCELGGYPCAWTEVPPEVMRRSVELADQAGAILDGGGSTADAAAVLKDASPVELQYDQRVIRFRLRGGRPVWLGHPDDGDGASAPIATPTPDVVAAAAALHPRSGVPRSVVSPGKDPKTAYLLDPFAWQPLQAGKTASIVEILSSTRGYEGSVTYLANASKESTSVAVAQFARFAGHNVVYVSTHGATICEDLTTGNDIPCRTIIAAHQVSSALTAMAESAEKGVDFFRYEDGSYWVVLNADFFRHHYPGGLQDALVVFDGCKTAGSDMTEALEGWNTNFAGWDEGVSAQGSSQVMGPFFARLAQGRAIHEVYESMAAEGGLRDKWGLRGAVLLIGEQNIRIRELPRVIDAFTGSTLTNSSEMEIDGYTDDGKPDSLLFVTEVEGVPAGEAEHYRVHFFIDGVEFANESLVDFAAPNGEYRWTGSAEFALGYDVSKGQRVEIKVYVDLPEGGMSMFAATPTIVEKKWWPGRVWQGTFSKVTDLGFATIFLDVQAMFERDPDEPADTRYPTYLLKSGTMTWQLADGGGDDCTWMAPSVTTQLGPNDMDQFTFDMAAQPVQYRGIADTPGPYVELNVSCSEGSDPPVTTIEAGGTWFNAPQDRNFAVSVNAFGGSYALNAVSYNTWMVTKVE